MTKELKVFISWSGNRSRLIAEEVKAFLNRTIPEIIAWISDDNLHKGEVWSKDIINALSEHSVGLFCLTPENVNSSWMHFEAGALSKSCEDALICPLLYGLLPSDVDGPLSVYQATEFDKDDMWKLITALNDRMGRKQHDPASLEQKYEELWPGFQKSLEKISDEAITDSYSFVANVIKVFTKSGFPRPMAGDHAYFSSGFESHDLYSNAMKLAERRMYLFGRKNRKVFDKEHKDFFNGLQEKISSGFDLRVLFLDPKSPRDVLTRAHKDSDIKDQIKDGIKQAKIRLKENDIDVETHCRQYNTHRTVAMLIVDDAVIYSPVVVNSDGKIKSLTKAPFNVVSADSEFGKELIDDFMAKWNSSKSMKP